MGNQLGTAMMIVWAEMGLKIENTIETQESLTIYISVPEHSHRLDANQNEMSGINLSKRFKDVLTTMGVKRLTIKSKTRKNEYWTKEMGEAAMLQMKKTIYGSQY